MTIAERSAALIAAMNEIAAEVDDLNYDNDIRASIRAAALGLLRVSGGSGGDMGLIATVEWRDGCHCHSTSESEVIRADTPRAMGRLIAAHEHGGSSDLASARWFIEPNAPETADMEEAFRRFRDHNETTRRLKSAKDAAVKELRTRTSERDRAQRDLEVRRSELNDTGIGMRTELIATLTRLVAEAHKALDVAAAALEAHGTAAEVD